MNKNNKCLPYHTYTLFVLNLWVFNFSFLRL